MTSDSREPCLNEHGRPKAKLPSAAIARQVLKRRRRRPGIREPKTLHAYRCPKCGFYHLGHSEPDL